MKTCLLFVLLLLGITSFADNLPPVAVDDCEMVPQGVPVNLRPMENDRDEDGQLDFGGQLSTAIPDFGTVSISLGGWWVYTPDPGYLGTDSFGYQVCDNGTPALCDTAVVWLNVLPVGDMVFAESVYATTVDDTPVIIPNNDQGILDLNSKQILNAPKKGTLTQNASMEYVYQPDLDFTGNDSFTYAVCSQKDSTVCDMGYVYVTTSGQDGTSLTVLDDKSSMLVNTTTIIRVLKNDDYYSDMEIDLSTFNLVDFPAFGTAVVLPDYTVEYTPDLDYSGPDSFSYEVCPPLGNCRVGTVSVEVREQFGEHDLRFVTHSIDCDNMKYFVDIELKSSSPDAYYFLGSQSYQFSFPSSSLANPQVEEAFLFNGVSIQDNAGSLEYSLYGQHQLTTDNNMVSYKIKHIGGIGHRVDDVYQKVGRISFDILDLGNCFDLTWLDQATVVGMPTALEEIRETKIHTLGEGSYQSSESCPGFNAFVFLEGAVDATGTMTTMLNENGLLPGQTPTNPSSIPTPAGQPYNQAPWFYAGAESVANYDADIVDWILVGFTENPASSLPLFSQAALLHSDGRIELTAPQAVPTNHPNPLYVHIVHRNHMAIASRVPVSLSCNFVNIDFRQVPSYPTMGLDGQKLLPGGRNALFAGDIDQVIDSPGSDINGNDKTAWTAANGIFNAYQPTDTNLDGDTNALDKILWYENNGMNSGVRTY